MLSPTDLEELAAFIDGRLVGERKAQVEARLLRDEDYYDLFLETVRLQEEQAREERPPEVRGVRWQRFAAPLAAAAIFTFLAIGLLRLRADDWAAHLDPAAVVVGGESWDDPGWSRPRSADPVAGQYLPEQLAFRLGARTVDLRIALAAGDRASANRLGTQCAELARAAALLTAAAACDRVVQAAEQTASPVLEAAAAEAETLLKDSFSRGAPEARHFAFGQWAEAARLAAHSCDQGALQQIVRKAPDPVTPTLAPQLARLRQLVGQAVARDRSCADAAALLGELVRALAG